MAKPEDQIGSRGMETCSRISGGTGVVSGAQVPNPIGYTAFHADGRMMATVFRRDRPARGEAPRSLGEKAGPFDKTLAYVASYRLEADRVVHHDESGRKPDWEIDLSRPFTLTDERLEISGAPVVDPATPEEVIHRIAFVGA